MTGLPVRVAVVGGGLAGLAAALECADRGASVTLFEARSRLGGATFSIERDGVWLDNGQHVALRCCTAYLEFLERIGSADLLELQPRLRVPVLAPGGRRALLARTALPAPLHLAGALLRYSHLTLRERLSACRTALALRALDRSDPAVDDRTFADWLTERGESPNAIETLWNLIALPTLNLPAAEASLALAAKVFQTGLLEEAAASDVGIPAVPLQRLHGDAAAAALRARGAAIETGADVESVEPARAGLELRLRDRVHAADAVVVAVEHDAAARLLPAGALDPAVADGLGASGIVNVHLHLDRRVLDEPFVAAVRSPLQWVFDRTATAGVRTGQLLSVSLSGARRELELGRDELVESIHSALRELLPAARAATVLDAFVMRQPRATFAGRPGTARLRPGPRTRVAGLYLAGAWTDTGWPATMEGAVRSGLAAAREALAEPGRAGVAGVAPELEAVAS